MEKLDVEANIRTAKPNAVRSKGLVPAIVYARDFAPLSVEVNGKKMSTLFGAGANKNIIITLKVNDGSKVTDIPVLAHDLQINALNDKIIHIDFLKLNMEEEIKTKISVVLIGESIGVKLDGGILVQAMRQIEVKCLPGDIPDKITLDVSPLKINDSIHVRDIVPPKGVTIISSKDDVVTSVSMPSKEEEVAPAAAEAVAVGAVGETPAADGTAAAAPGDQKAGAAPAAAAAKGGAAPDAKGKAPAKPSK